MKSFSASSPWLKLEVRFAIYYIQQPDPKVGWKMHGRKNIVAARFSTVTFVLLKCRKIALDS